MTGRSGEIVASSSGTSTSHSLADDWVYFDFIASLTGVGGRVKVLDVERLLAVVSVMEIAVLALVAVIDLL